MNMQKITLFQKQVLTFYKENKRNLPWRIDKNQKPSPYHILVSEYMLQQTQVDRVVPKYHAFLKKFPTIESLAQASNKEVLAVWVGLGYNRRALYLRDTCVHIIQNHSGIIPMSPDILIALPGIGTYMAGILPVFIENKKHTVIETNIRTVFLYHFFKNKKEVNDTEILKYIELTLPTKNLRDWYYALMDYGTFLKKEKKIKNTQSASYTKQKPFLGSNRYVRGTIIRLASKKKIPRKEIYSLFPNYSPETVDTISNTLVKETILKQNKFYFYI